MKKILIFANNSGGLFDFRNELISSLVLGNNKVTAYTPFDIKVDELKNLGISVVNTPVDRRGLNPLKDIKLFWCYFKILRKEKPDLVITYTIKPNVYGGFACRLLKIPCAINITGLGTSFENDGLLRKIVICMYRISCRRAKIVFFENEENRQIFINKGIVKVEQSHTLNGAGVNTERFQVADYPEGEKIKFLFIGRVMAEKGVDELFEAMKKLTSDGVECELDILGGYEENYEDIIKKYEKEGWLHYRGYQLDVRPFIGASHCFVLPSWHEGMANTNLESAAVGRPIITSNIHGCMEAIIDGKTGFLVERKNAEDLYKKMKKMTQLSYEERKAMGLAGRELMEEVFDKRKVVKDTIQYL